MITIKELDIKYIEEIKSLFAEIFTNEPWNDDWSDEAQLHEYIMDLIGNRIFFCRLRELFLHTGFIRSKGLLN